MAVQRDNQDFVVLGSLVGLGSFFIGNAILFLVVTKRAWRSPEIVLTGGILLFLFGWIASAILAHRNASSRVVSWIVMVIVLFIASITHLVVWLMQP